jgi:hypothetical protein
MYSTAPIDMTVAAPQIGKSIVLGWWVLAGAWMDGGVLPFPSWIAAPTFEQAKDRYLRYVVAPAESAGILESATESVPLKAKLTNGSVIEGRSWDSPDGLWGSTVARIGVDEFGFLTQKAWLAMRSRVSETRLMGLGFIRGCGNVGEVNGKAEQLYLLGQNKTPGYASRTWTWRDRAKAAPCACPGHPPCEIASAGEHQIDCQRGMYLVDLKSIQDDISDAQFRQLYGAEWLDWAALPAYTFERAIHVNAARAERQAELPLDLSCDFNVDPMAWVIGQHKGPECWVFDEIAIPGGATTEQAAREFNRRCPAPAPVHVYGDRNGKSRSVRSNKTDYAIIREIIAPGRSAFEIHVPEDNPPVVDRINAYNAKLCTASGLRTYFVHPRCEKLATDLARVSLKPGTRDFDTKDKTLGHFTAADGYRVARLYPVRMKVEGRGGKVQAEGLPRYA